MNLFQWESGTDCSQLPLAVPPPIRLPPEQSQAAYLTRQALKARYHFQKREGVPSHLTMPELRESEITYRNRVFKRALQLARRGKWLACDLTIMIHLRNLGISLTDPQKHAIAIAKARQVWDQKGPCLEEAYVDF